MRKMKTFRGKFLVGLAKWFYRLRIITKEDLEYQAAKTEWFELLHLVRSR